MNPPRAIPDRLRLLASTILSKKNFKYLFFLASTLLILCCSYFRSFDLYELQSYDWRCQLRGPRPVSEEIVLVDIWDDTLEQLGAWPFEREYHAELIKVLSQSGVKAVAFDILFVEPRSSDVEVAKAAEEAKNIYFVYAFLSPENQRGRFVSKKILAPIIETYKNSAKGTGHVNTMADIDGKRRRVIPTVYHNDALHLQLSFQIAADLYGIKKDDLRIKPRRYIELGNKRRIPLDDEGYYVVNYAGKWEQSFQHYSYFDILASYVEKQSGAKPRIDLDELKGKVCFVGLTALGSHDTSPIPIQPIYPMVGAYANILNNILLNDFIVRLDRVWNLIILLILVAWVGFISMRMKPLAALLRTLAIMTIYSLCVIVVFNRWGLWIDFFYPIFVMLVIYAAATLGRVVLEMRKREVIEGELKIASQIQQSFLPEASPIKKGLTLAYYMKPAKAVGGDLFTFVPLADEKLGVMVGDVSGKGTPAALFMAKIVSEFKYSARDDASPSAVLLKLNNAIASEATGGLFVTSVYAIFDTKNRKVAISNAGHLPVVVVHENGSTEELLADDGMPIGVMEGVEFSTLEKEIIVGDCFAFYSDGISEARNRKKGEYGIEALKSTMKSHRYLETAQMLKKVTQEINLFMGKAEQHDDMTLILVKVEPDHG